MADHLEFLKGIIPTPPPPREVKKVGYRGYVAERLNSTLNDLPNIPPEELEVYADFFAAQCRYSYMRQIGMDQQTWRLRPSGQKCSLSEWFKRMGRSPGHVSTGRLGTFLAGDIAEAFTVTMLYIAGVDCFDYQKEVTIPTPNGMPDTRGTLDIRARCKGKVLTIDVKSTTGRGIRDARGGYQKDLWGYRRQLKAYDLSPELDPPNDLLLLLFFNKETWREWVEVPVPKASEEDYDNWCLHCQAVMSEMQPGQPSWAGKLKLRPKLKLWEIEDPRCRYCDFIRECYPEAFERNPGRKDWHIRRK